MMSRLSRRSSILKLGHPLEDIHNLSLSERPLKKRRVSFANVVNIKEFSKNQLNHDPASAIDVVPNADSFNGDDGEDTDTVIQISTPRGKKSRRISTDPECGLKRLSVIPPLEKSFYLTDEHFESYEDTEATLPKHDDVATSDSPAKNDVGGENLPENNAPTDTGECICITSESPGSISMCNNSLGSSSLCMDMTIQQQMSPSSLFSPDDLLKKSSRTIAQLNRDSTVCSENLNITFTKSFSDLTIPPSSSEQLDFTCGTLNSGRSPVSLNNASCQLRSSFEQSKEKEIMPINSPSDQLEITCEQIESKDSAVGLGSHSNSDTNQLDFMCVNSIHRDLASLLPKLSGKLQTEDRESSTVLLSGGSQLEITCEPVLRKDTPLAFKSHLTDQGVEIEYASSPSVSLSSKSRNPHEDSVRSNTAGDCDNWLSDMADPDPSFFEEVSAVQSQVSTISKSTTSGESRQGVCNQSVRSIEHFEMPTLKRVYSMKPETIMESPIIETPQAIPIKNNVSCTFDSSGHTVVKSDSLVEVDDMLSVHDVGPSLSSSVFSKFCQALNCDQTLAYSPTKDGEAHRHLTGKVFFFEHLEDIQTRLVTIQKSIRKRLHDAKYTCAHEVVSSCLKLLLIPAHRALCVVGILISYGTLSGLSEATLLEQLPLEPLPVIVESTEDFDGSLKSKVTWISKMHNLLHDNVYPTIDEAIGDASFIYKWELQRCNREAIELSLLQDTALAVRLSPETDFDADVPDIEILSVDIGTSNRPKRLLQPIVQCTSTAQIAKSIYEVYQQHVDDQY